MRALDLFAGTGWGVACRNLGIEEAGVDNAPAVLATRAANGMTTIFEDVWDGLEGRAEVPVHDILIASPPCQTFSMAGSGKGRAALDDVLRLIAEEAWLRPADMRGFAATHGDDRTALVLAPLAYVAQHWPRFVVFEQVPPVLPVWEACAEVLRDMGYSAWTGCLQAEQYGVPQTRKRAILIARRDGLEATPPPPTHSRYYARTPDRYDAGVLPWVSMAEALGWAREDVAVKRMGAGMVERHGERPGRAAALPAFTVRASAGGMEPGGFRVLRSNYGTGGDPANRGERNEDQPAPTITSKVDRNQWRFAAAGRTEPNAQRQRARGQDQPAATVTGSRSASWVTDERVRNISLEEAARLQTYPAGFEWVGARTASFQQIGNAVPPLLAKAILQWIAA